MLFLQTWYDSARIIPASESEFRLPVDEQHISIYFCLLGISPPFLARKAICQRHLGCLPPWHTPYAALIEWHADINICDTKLLTYRPVTLM